MPEDYLKTMVKDILKEVLKVGDDLNRLLKQMDEDQKKKNG